MTQPTAPQELLDGVLAYLATVRHGRLWCACGYLIWCCECRFDCPGVKAMIISNHSLCIKPEMKQSKR